MGRTYGSLERRLEDFIADHLEGLENDERVEALGWYCQGLGLELPGKTMSGIANRLDPENFEQRRQRMQRAVTKGRFSHDDLFERVQRTVFSDGPALTALAIDDTGIAKKGKLSPGVQRQYSGTLGKIDNCQIIVSLHGVADDFGACVGAELFLPESWVDDTERLRRAKVPEDRICVRTKTEIAVELLKAAVNNGAPNIPVVADAAYGDSRNFREAIRELDRHYVVAISSNTTVWPPGAVPRVPTSKGKVGRPPSWERDAKGKKPERVDVLAQKLWKNGKFKTVIWRKGTKGSMRGLFCAARVHSAERRTRDRKAGEEIWLLTQRDATSDCGFRFFFSSLPKTTSLRKLTQIAKVRWHIERDYQDLKQKLGFDKYEGRTWGGLHRHIAMAALLHAFISLHREAFSPDPFHAHMDLGGLLPCPTCRAHALGGEMPSMPESLQT